MVFNNISKDQAIKIVSSILYKNDPAGLCACDVPENEYFLEAKVLVDILDKKTHFFHFWKDIHDVLVRSFEKDFNEQTCKKISHEIAVSLSLTSFAEELRKNPALKKLDDDLCLTIHDCFKVTFDLSGKVFINNEYFCFCEEQDIEDLLTNFVINDDAIYILYSHRYRLFKKSHIKVCDRNSVTIDDLRKNNKVLMIFDNKSLIYKRSNLILKIALLINIVGKSIKIYGEEPQIGLEDAKYSFLKLEKNDQINKYLFEDSNGEQHSIEVYNPKACEHSQNYIIIGIADKIVWHFGKNNNSKFKKTFYLENNTVRTIESTSKS